MIRVPDEKELARCGRTELIAIVRKLEEERANLRGILELADHSLTYHQCAQYGDKACSNCELHRDVRAALRVEP